VHKTKRAHKFRFYPNDEQRIILAQTFGCVRFVYNWGLHTRSTAYKERGEKLSYNDLAALLPDLKKQYPWLGDISRVPIQQSLRHLDSAFKNFFEGHANYPTWKKKQNSQSATFAANAFKWDGAALTLAKMHAPLDIHWHRDLPKHATPSSVTISKDCANRYFVSMNRNKARLKAARIHGRIQDRRRDYQHKLSTRIKHENQVICVESLAVKNMVKNHKLAKAISDVGWGEFIRQLEYKSEWHGRTLIKIDQWYPSSKACHACKHVVDSLPLDIGEWVCPQCGGVHDRDTNAALNILAEGLSASACGGRVRPVRAKARRATSVEAGKAHS
jgi:putative transposase